MSVNEVVSKDLVMSHEEGPIKRRSKGQKTREKILLSAIEILACTGIKGTTHRAIASHAQLQLSLTTYYFKDIQELIHQAFKLNSERILASTGSVLDDVFAVMTSITKSELRNKTLKKQVCQQLTEITSQHLISNIKNKAIELTVEQLMLIEAKVTPELQQLAQEHELAQLVPFEELCHRFNNVNPEIDAKILHTVLSQLQYSQLSRQTSIDSDLIEQSTQRIIGWIMSVK